MRIDWRPSGGRGEYELAGTGAGYGAADLLEWTIHLDLSALGWRQTELLVSDQGGKPRLRRVGKPHHIQRQLASALLLPRSRRSDKNLAQGSPVMVDQRYLITSVSLSEVTLDSSTEIIQARVDEITVANASRSETIDVAERSRSIGLVHRRSDEFPDSLASLLAGHQEALDESPSIEPGVETLQRRLIRTLELEHVVPYVGRTDPVPALLSFILGKLLSVPRPGEASPDEPEMRLAATRVWRLTAQRGASMTRFREAVMKAYNSTCVFCGVRLPSKKHEMTAGCQAAHILPYAEFDLDHVTNGMCLCPTHHWAFDEYLLVVDAELGRYELRVSKRAERLLPPESLVLLQEIAGSISDDRLPKDNKDWPRPEYLSRLYTDNLTD